MLNFDVVLITDGHMAYRDLWSQLMPLQATFYNYTLPTYYFPLVKNTRTCLKKKVIVLVILTQG